MTASSYPGPPDGPLSDGVVRLRPWDEQDLPCIEAAAQDPGIPQGSTVPTVYSRPEGLAFIARQHTRLTSGQGVSLAITEEATDRAVGLVILQVRPQPGVAGLGYWLVPAARRRGTGSRAVALMTTWGLGAAGFARVEAWVEPGNTASRRLLEVCGFELEGRLRSFLTLGPHRADALVYSRVTAAR